MQAKIYGIKNCDTMKKAFKWLDTHGISYDFHDYKKQGIDEHVLCDALTQHGWESVINKRGTTWRKLPENVQSTMNNENAVLAATENPSLVKRPLLVKDGDVILGFKDEVYGAVFK